MVMKIASGQLTTYSEPSAQGAALALGETSTAQRDTLLAASRTQVFTLDRLIETVADKSYTLLLNAAFAGVITAVTTKSASGTATCTVKINATPIGATANAASSTEVTQANATLGVFAVGDDIVLTTSANSTCLDLSVSILYTRVLV